MTGTRAAVRYAKALLQHSASTQSSARIFEDMESIVQTLEGSKDLRIALKSPIVKTQDKKAALLEIFKGQSKEANDLIEVLTENERTSLLGAVATSYMQLYNNQQGIKVATVTTAVPLSSDLEKKMLAKVEEITGSKKVSLNNIIDESIIGGFVLRIDDTQYNASTANQLSNIKREFSKSL